MWEQAVPQVQSLSFSVRGLTLDIKHRYSKQRELTKNIHDDLKLKKKVVYIKIFQCFKG